MVKVNDKQLRSLVEYGLAPDKFILPPPPKPTKQQTLDEFQ